MKTVHAAIVLGSLVLVGAAAAFLTAGCEATESAENAIVVSPASSTLSGRSGVTLTASASSNSVLVLPLTWDVGNDALGSIAENVGVSAVYVSNGSTGVNTVVVRDQADAEGLAVITQQ